MVVAVGLDELPLGHPQKSRRFPGRHSCLHQLGRGSMPKEVRDDLHRMTEPRCDERRHPRRLDGGTERLLDRFHGPALPLHHGASGDTPVAASAQVREQPPRDSHWRLALVASSPTDGTAVEHPAFEVDPAAANGGRQRRLTDCIERVPV
jgi:hypothetical protein